MQTDSIIKNLTDRFSAPLKDFYKRRIIFWHDPEGEFSEFIDSVEIPDVKVIKLTGTNNFAVKMLLCETDLDSNYLVYNPITYSDIRDNWLLDIERYSEEFRADLLSMRMAQLNIPSANKMRKTVKMYSKFFDNKERMSKLLSFKTVYSSPFKLHIDVLSVLVGTMDNTASGVIRSVLINGLDEKNNSALSNIKKFGNEDVFWELLAKITGFIKLENSSLTDLASHILLTALSATIDSAHLNGFQKYIAEPFQQFCYSLIYDWSHSNDDDTLYDIAREVEDYLHIPARFDKLEVSDLLLCECFPCINECILRKFMSEISAYVIKIDDILTAVEKRRTMKWYKRVRYYYEGLLQVAKMQQFYQMYNCDFHFTKHKDLWKAYTDKYYLMDTYYRKFHSAFGKSLKQSSTVLEDLYKDVADYVEGIYKNWFLNKLGENWFTLIRESLNESAYLSDIPQQENFYNNSVLPLSNNSRVYVIISDALRYETATELSLQLTQETKGTSTISAMQAIFPTTTKFGMSALLPHSQLTLTDNMSVLCDGSSNDNTESRDKILKKAYEKNTAVTYKNLLTMKQSERRNLVSGAKVVYIYHNTIDADGEKLSTEDKVFEACETAIDEIKNLVRIITNELSGTNILITADHGFLYSYNALGEADKTDKNLIDGEIIEIDHRHIIASADSHSDMLMSVSLEHLNSDKTGFTPFEYNRIKKQGGGINYVHGGFSLQEAVVPIITFKNIRSSSKQFVDIKKAEISLISQTRKVSNSIFSLEFYQRNAVQGKITPATYKIFMVDSNNNAVSDVQTIISDKTSTNDTDRVFRLRFTLKGLEYKNTDIYYLVITDKDSATVIEQIEFSIDIAFSDAFDDFEF